MFIVIFVNALIGRRKLSKSVVCSFKRQRVSKVNDLSKHLDIKMPTVTNMINEVVHYLFNIKKGKKEALNNS